MAYTKQTFTSGQILKASDLNTMSQGIVDKQDKLISGTNLKTINGTSLLGSGDITVEGGGAVSVNTSKSTRYIHMSFDDVSTVITELAKGTLTSAFDNSFLAMLKQAHEDYGFVFSLYLQSKPSSISTKYQAELREASSWLKWGLHSFNGGNYGSSTYAQGKADWESMVDVVMSLTGTHEAIDRMPRLHQFYGSEVALQGMRDAKIGALGFLSTDDTRKAYYLSQEQLDWLYEGENDHLTDFENGLVFYRTDLRLDWFAKAGFTYNAASGMSNHVPMDDSDIAGELEVRYNGKLYQNTWDCFVVFTHEWQPTNAVSSALTAIGEFAVAKGISFDFPQNRTATVSDYDIHAESSVEVESVTVDSALSTTSTNPVQNKVINASIVSLQSYIQGLEDRLTALEASGGSTTLHTITYNLTNVTSSNTLSKVVSGNAYGTTLTADSGYDIDTVMVTMGGTDVTSDAYSDGVITIESVTGDVVITATGVESSSGDDGGVLGQTTLSGGHGTSTVTIVDNFNDAVIVNGYSNGADDGTPTATVGRASYKDYVFKVTGGSTLNFTQVTTGLAYSVIEYTNIPLSSSTVNRAGQIAKAWLTNDLALHSSTNYIRIAFKNGDGSSDFTEDQLALLKGALVIS